jgi:hypothetical protein
VMVHLCEGKFAVCQVDARNLLGVVDRGSPRLRLNELERELFWFCLERPKPRLLPLGGRDDGGRHVRRNVPI